MTGISLHMQWPLKYQLFKMANMMALCAVCRALEGMLDTGPPDLILDSTRSGYASQAVKRVSRELAIPTVVLTYDDKLENL
jgi:hypothetical protein